LANWIVRDLKSAHRRPLSTAGQYVKDSFGEASLLKDAARRAAGATLPLSDPIGVVLATRVSFFCAERHRLLLKQRIADLSVFLLIVISSISEMDYVITVSPRWITDVSI
jgi:hypothetical protein